MILFLDQYFQIDSRILPMKDSILSASFSKDVFPYKPLPFFSIGKIDLNTFWPFRCFRITDIGLESLSEGLKGLVSLQRLSLLFDRWTSRLFISILILLQVLGNYEFWTWKAWKRLQRNEISPKYSAQFDIVKENGFVKRFIEF